MSLTLQGAGSGSETQTPVTPYATQVLATAGLISYWRMNEASGTSATDSKGTNTGTYGGTVTLQAAGATTDGNKAISVAGAGSFRAPINLSTFNQITLEWWMLWPSFANDSAICLEYTADAFSNAGGVVVTPNEGSGSFQVGYLAGSPAGINFTRPSAGTYHHYVVLVDNTVGTNAGGIQLYIDSVSQSGSVVNSGTPGINFANSSIFGMARNAASNFSTGSFDELAIYSGLLSPATITSHYAGR